MSSQHQCSAVHTGWLCPHVGVEVNEGKAALEEWCTKNPEVTGQSVSVKGKKKIAADKDSGSPPAHCRSHDLAIGSGALSRCEVNTPSRQADATMARADSTVGGKCQAGTGLAEIEAIWQSGLRQDLQE